MKKKLFSLILIINIVVIFGDLGFQKGVFAQCQKSMVDALFLVGKIVKINKEKHKIQVVILNNNIYKNKKVWVKIKDNSLKKLHLGDKVEFFINFDSKTGNVEGVLVNNEKF